MNSIQQQQDYESKIFIENFSFRLRQRSITQRHQIYNMICILKNEKTNKLLLLSSNKKLFNDSTSKSKSNLNPKAKIFISRQFSF